MTTLLLRLGMLIGAALEVRHVDTHLADYSPPCPKQTENCLALVLQHSVAVPLASILDGALAGLLVAAAIVLPVRILGSLARP